MAELTKSSLEDSRTDILHDIAIRLADLNTQAQLEVAIPTLDFLQEIEDKTDEDIKKLRAQEKFILLLESEEYRNRLQNEITDKFNERDTDFLSKYLDELKYEDEVAELNLQLVPAMQQLQQELIDGVLSTPVVH